MCRLRSSTHDVGVFLNCCIQLTTNWSCMDKTEHTDWSRTLWKQIIIHCYQIIISSNDKPLCIYTHREAIYRLVPHNCAYIYRFQFSMQNISRQLLLFVYMYTTLHTVQVASVSALFVPVAGWEVQGSSLMWCVHAHLYYQMHVHITILFLNTNTPRLHLKIPWWLTHAIVTQSVLH